MAAPFQVNVTIDAGTDFTQEFTITEPNGVRVDITGYTFLANLGKHPTAIDAAVSTSGNKVYDYLNFATRVVDGANGIYSISLTAKQTSALAEGKYVYNVVMEDLNKDRISVIGGLAFVSVAFGALNN